MLQLNRKCTRIKINDFCWSATQNTENKNQQTKTKKNQSIKFYDFKIRLLWAFKKQLLNNRLNLTLSET